MKIKFLVDYNGVLTGERFFAAGSEVELDANIDAESLVRDKRAEYVAEKVTKPKATPAKRTRRKKVS